MVLGMLIESNLPVDLLEQLLGKGLAPWELNQSGFRTEVGRAELLMINNEG